MFVSCTKGGGGGKKHSTSLHFRYIIKLLIILNLTSDLYSLLCVCVCVSLSLSLSLGYPSDGLAELAVHGSLRGGGGSGGVWGGLLDLSPQQPAQPQPHPVDPAAGGRGLGLLLHPHTGSGCCHGNGVSPPLLAAILVSSFIHPTPCTLDLLYLALHRFFYLSFLVSH